MERRRPPAVAGAVVPADEGVPAPHVEPLLGGEPLAELVRVAKPGARCAIGVNAAHFGEYGFADWLDATLLKMPIIGEIMYEAVVARFARTLALLVGNGVRVVEALPLAEQATENRLAIARNALLAQEVADLKAGTAAIEARARSDLGMIRQGEVFYQIVSPTPRDTP